MALFGKKEKESRLQEDIAQKREQFRNQANQVLAQLVPGSQEYLQAQTEITRLESIGEDHLREREQFLQQIFPQLVSQQQSRIASGGPATPFEARTQAAFGGLREAAQPVPFEQDLLNALTGTETTTPSGAIFTRAMSRAAAPTIDDDVFRNALKLVEDRVNEEYAGRGLIGSGLRLEGLGRAGVEASIAESERQDALRQEAYQNALGLFDSGEVLRNRQIGLEGDLVNLQLGRESNLTGLLSENTNLRLNDLVRQLERRSTQATDDRLDAEADAAARRAALGQAVGTGLAVAAAPFTGGASLALAPAAGQLGSAATGGAPRTAGQIQAVQQSQAPAGTTQPLSRQSSGGLDLAQLLKLLQQSGAVN